MQAMRTIEDVVRAHSRAKGYYDNGTDLLGVRSKGQIQWFRMDEKGVYRQTGSTINPGPGGQYHRLENSEQERKTR